MVVVAAILALLVAHTAHAATVDRESSQQAPVDLINADRPGIAEGPGVVAPGRFQLEIGFHRESERDPAGRFTTTLMPTLVRAGIGGAAELRVETNGYTRAEAATTAGTERATGWSPLSIGMKYQFLAGDARPVSMALLGRVSPSTGTGTFKSGGLAADLRLAVEWTLSPLVSLNPNVGVARVEEGPDATFTAALAAATLTFTRSPRILPFLDVGYQDPISRDGGAAVIVDAGLAWIVGSNVQIDVSAGRGVHGAAAPFVAVGISLRR